MLAAFALGLASIVAAFVSAGTGQRRLRLSALDVRRPRTVGRRGRSPDDPRRRTPGSPRLKRHLWRMCVALFIAAASFFLGPVRRIPEPLRIPALRLIPLVVLVTMVYWLWRYRRKRIFSRRHRRHRT